MPTELIDKSCTSALLSIKKGGPTYMATMSDVRRLSFFIAESENCSAPNQRSSLALGNYKARSSGKCIRGKGKTKHAALTGAQRRQLEPVETRSTGSLATSRGE